MTTLTGGHQEEVERLMGVAHQYVERGYYALEAGKHVRRVLGALLMMSDREPTRRDIAFLQAEYDLIAAGESLAVGSAVHSEKCGCNPYGTARELRCCQ